MANSPNFCSKCGNSLAGRTKFCGHCGARIVSTVIVPAKQGAIPMHGLSLLLLIGAVLTGAYMLSHHMLEYRAAHPADPPFWQPGPPADLLTMLRRGPTFGPEIVGLKPLPQEAQMKIAEAICRVIVTDYHLYKYGSTQADPARQALVNQEAEQLVEQTSQLYADKAAARDSAKFELAEAANVLRDEFQGMDPVQGCKMIKPILDNPDRLSF